MLRVPDDVRSTHSQDGAIVLNIQHGQMFSLNIVGSKILDLLKRGYAEPHIAEEISREFGVSRDITDADVREFIRMLTEHHLLEMRDPGASL
jgi:hypothetical protein